MLQWTFIADGKSFRTVIIQKTSDVSEKNVASLVGALGHQ